MPDLNAKQSSLSAGGGAFTLDRLTIGVFLNDQPTHRLSLGSDRVTHQPLQKQQGWILPPGASGVCQYDAPLDVIMVDIDAKLLIEAGLTNPSEIAPIVGALDPLTLQLALQAPGFEANGTLYKETMQRALAAHLSTIIQPRINLDIPIEDVRLRRVVAYIQDHLADDISLDQLAQIAAMSPHHFSRAFKTALGKSPLQYVLSLRIEKAKVLLKTTKLAVSEICFRTGYQDVSRFGQHFKRATGSTPAQYRAG